MQHRHIQDLLMIRERGRSNRVYEGRAKPKYPSTLLAGAVLELANIRRHARRAPHFPITYSKEKPDKNASQTARTQSQGSNKVPYMPERSKTKMNDLRFLKWERDRNSKHIDSLLLLLEISRSRVHVTKKNK